jgi:hypothetical protein
MSTREHNGKTYLQCEVDQLDLLGSDGQGKEKSNDAPAPEAAEEPFPF